MQAYLFILGEKFNCWSELESLLRNQSQSLILTETSTVPDSFKFSVLKTGQNDSEIYTFLHNTCTEVVIVESELTNALLRKFVSKAKSRLRSIVHINPDEKYNDKVRRHELWWDVPAAEGLRKLAECVEKKIS